MNNQEHFTEEECNPSNFNFEGLFESRLRDSLKRGGKTAVVKERAEKNGFKVVDVSETETEPFQGDFEQLPLSFQRVVSAGMVDKSEFSDLEGGIPW